MPAGGHRSTRAERGRRAEGAGVTRPSSPPGLTSGAAAQRPVTSEAEAGRRPCRPAVRSPGRLPQVLDGQRAAGTYVVRAALRCGADRPAGQEGLRRQVQRCLLAAQPLERRDDLLAAAQVAQVLTAPGQTVHALAPDARCRPGRTGR